MMGTCPLCGKASRSWHTHHVVFRQDGGTNHHANLLDICVSCHALIHNGHEDDRKPRDFAAMYHQWARWGLDFCQHSSRAGGPEIPDDAPRAECDRVIRTLGLANYSFYRNVIDGDAGSLRACQRHFAALSAWDGTSFPRPFLASVAMMGVIVERVTRAALPAGEIVVPLPQKEHRHAA